LNPFRLSSHHSHTTYTFYLGDQPQIFTAGDGSAPLEHLEILLMDGGILGNHFAQTDFASASLEF